jgi:hypothetical protein
MSPDITVIKRKARGFFKSEDFKTVKQAVQDVNNIIRNASVLVRAYYLSEFRKDPNTPIVLDEQLLDFACAVVQKKNQPSRGKNRTNQTLVTLYQKLVELHNEIFGDSDVSTKLSVSHILQYSINNLLTAYKNNVELHFRKYPVKLIKCLLLKKGIERKEAVKIANIITDGFLNKANIPDEHLQGEDPNHYAYMFPTTGEQKYYIQKMVTINRFLQSVNLSDLPESERKLLNPIPFHSSHIPMHIRLDTAGMSQLLMTTERIDEFKKQYFIDTGEELKVNDKSDLLNGFIATHGRKPVSKQEEVRPSNKLWEFVTNVKTCKQMKEFYHPKYNEKQEKKQKDLYVFDNSIVTDGISVSIQLIRQQSSGKKCYKPKNTNISLKCKTKNIKTKQPQQVPEVTISNTAKRLAIDPGKIDILFVTDGVETLRYTKAQRQNDTGLVIRNKVTSKLRKKHDIVDFETKVLSECSKKSCIYNEFKKYCQLKMRQETKLNKVYSHPVFRQFKFLVYCRMKSSEHKFANKIKEKFSKSNVRTKSTRITALNDAQIANAAKKTDELVIGYGNWGRNPNLKNTAPTPGIGVRRRLEKHFKTVTVSEYMTSQNCPCCKKEQSLKKHVINNREIHHLLCCQNSKCKSRWWNRNVAGSINILKNFFENKFS